jgi:phosphoglycerate dehydrogenase-like enzyme
MQAKSLRALITCEVTPKFLASLKERNIDFELSGWGQDGKTLSEVELIAKAQNCEIVIVEIEELNRKVLESLPNLKFVGVSRGTPVNVDLGFCEQQRIPVVHTPGRNADSVADYCLAMMLDLSRKLTSSSRHLSDKGWLFEGKLPYLEFRGREVGNLVIGLYGFGQIGIRVAQRLSGGFGAKVYYFDPFVESSNYATKVDSLDDLFEISDIVSLHAPVLVGTENSIDRALLKKLGPEGILISSARAKLVIEEDLYEALKTKEIASAAIDVFWSEPIEVTDRWLALPNVICTPHIAGASLDVVSNHCETILNGIDKWLSSNNTVKGPA